MCEKERERETRRLRHREKIKADRDTEKYRKGRMIKKDRGTDTTR